MVNTAAKFIAGDAYCPIAALFLSRLQAILAPSNV